MFSFAPLLDSVEEAGERPVYPSKDVLQHLGVDVAEFREGALQFWELILLYPVVDETT